jgi:hypothetical protein
MATIKPRRGTAAPGTGAINQNELAVDTTNKRIYIGAANGSGILIGSAPGGSDTQVQFNDGGNLSGDSGLTYNKTTDTLTAGSISTTGLEAKTVGGDEGGQIDFGLAATNTTLSSGVAIDIYQNRLRIFEKGGTTRGVYIDLTAAGAGIATNLLASSSSPGGSDTFVQFNDGSTFGGDAGLTYNKSTDSLTIAGDLAVNGGDITTTTTTATIFNTTATTVDAFGAATTLNIGPSATTTQTLNLFTSSLSSGQTKTINIGTGAAATRTVAMNLGSGGGAMYLQCLGGVYIGTNDGANGSTLYTDTISAYDAGTLLTILAGSTGIALDGTSDIEIGDISQNGDGTRISVSDGNALVSLYASNGLALQNNAGLFFYESSLNGTNYVGFRAPTSLSADNIWTLPSADGAAGQLLSTNGSDVLGWSSMVGNELALFNLGII